MKKRTAAVLLFWLFAALQIYLQREFAGAEEMDGLQSTFLRYHSDWFQRYQFLYAQFLFLFLYVLRTPYLQPEFHVRIGRRLPRVLLQRSLREGFTLATVFSVILWLVAVGSGLTLDSPAAMLAGYLRLSLFCIVSLLTYGALYVLFGRELHAIIGYLILQWFWVILIIEIDWYLLGNILETYYEETMLGFSLFQTIVGGLAVLSIFLNQDREHNLKTIRQG